MGPVAPIPGATAWHRAEFRWSWGATRMHFIVILIPHAETTAQGIDEAKDIAYRWARKNKPGWPRGWQTGFTLFPVFATGNASPDARHWFGRSLEKHWAAFVVPVMHEAATNSIYAVRVGGLFGAAFNSELRHILRTLFHVSI